MYKSTNSKYLHINMDRQCYFYNNPCRPVGVIYTLQILMFTYSLIYISLHIQSTYYVIKSSNIQKSLSILLLDNSLCQNIAFNSKYILFIKKLGIITVSER